MVSDELYNTLFDEKILEIISDSADGCGEDMAFAAEIDEIQRLRLEEDDGLDQGEWVTNVQSADWREVSQRCQDLLAKRTKDLKLMFWLVESTIKTHGFIGLSASMTLLERFLDNFWDGLYPRIEDDDIEPRIGLVEWVTKTVERRIKEVPLAESDLGEYGYNHFISARALDERLKRTDGEEQPSGALTLTDYQSAVRATDVNMMRDKMQCIDDLSTQWRSFGNRMDNLLGHDAPVFSKVNDLLDEIFLHLESLVGRLTSTPVQSDDEQPTEQSSTAPISSQSIGQGFSPTSATHLENRQQALKLLAEIQDYFALNEPHSPVTYMLAKTIAWANMPLHQWLEQVVKQPDQLEQLKDVLGAAHQHHEG